METVLPLLPEQNEGNEQADDGSDNELFIDDRGSEQEHLAPGLADFQSDAGSGAHFKIAGARTPSVHSPTAALPVTNIQAN